MEDYRPRLYARYSLHATAGRTSLTPADLASRRPYLNALIRRHFPEDRAARVLDLGCGPGALLFFAREHGYRHVRGVDASATQVQCAHSLGLTDVRHGDVFQAIRDAPPASLDVVVAFDVLEHLRKDEQLALADAIHAALAPGGRLIAHVPNGDGPFFGRVFFGDFTHETAFTRSSMNQLLGAAGFSGVTCYEDAPVVHGFKSGVRAVLWRGVRTALRAYVAIETGSTAPDAIFSQNLLAVADR